MFRTDDCLAQGLFRLVSKGIDAKLRRVSRSLLALAATSTLAACGLTPTSGPSTRAITRAGAGELDQSAIAVVDVSNELAQHLVDQARPRQFSDVLGDGFPVGTLIGRGDVLDISIWEAPPAALFGAAGSDARLTSSSSTARGTSLPDQMVDNDGRVTIPFVGPILVVGRSPQQIENLITSRLIGKAHEPQVLVRVAQNANRTVTVVGDVTNSARVPLSPRGERILDVLAAVGGTRQSTIKTTVQITREAQVVNMPLDAVIRDPHQNIRLQPGDVVTALYQPYSFTALGATGRNEEIPFEASGLTLSQALGRAQGLQDARADAKGVFIFRLESAAALATSPELKARALPNGRIPVIYRINLRDPRTMFIAQTFPIRDKDILYVSNAPIADIQKFVNVIYASVLPIATAATVAP